MCGSAWLMNQTDVPVAGSMRRCSTERHIPSRRAMASAWHHHWGHQFRFPAVDVPAVGADEVVVHEDLEGRVVQLRGRRCVIGLVVRGDLVDPELVGAVHVVGVQVVEVVHEALTQGLGVGAVAAASCLWRSWRESMAWVRCGRLRGRGCGWRP